MSDSPDLKVVEAHAVDPNSFKIAAKDAKGHSDRLWVSVIPATSRVVSEIVASKQFPFRTKGDLLRWCVSEGIKRLQALGAVKSVQAIADATNAIMADVEYYNEFRHTIDLFKAKKQMYLGMGEVTEARRLTMDVIDHLHDMPEGFWKKKYLDEVKREAGDLLNDLPKARLDQLFG